MKQAKLIDTNVIIRFVTKDDKSLLKEAKEVFLQIERGEMVAELPDFIVAEVAYVLNKIYGYHKAEVENVIKLLLQYDNIIANKIMIYKASEIYVNKNMDFADAMQCAMRALEGYEIVSFDKKVQRC